MSPVLKISMTTWSLIFYFRSTSHRHSLNAHTVTHTDTPTHKHKHTQTDTHPHTHKLTYRDTHTHNPPTHSHTPTHKHTHTPTTHTNIHITYTLFYKKNFIRDAKRSKFKKIKLKQSQPQNSWHKVKFKNIDVNYKIIKNKF